MAGGYSLINNTIFENNYIQFNSSWAMSGGAAIGGNDALNLTLTNCIFKDNNISMGIALRHFDIACNKFGIDVDYSKIDVKKRMAKEYYITATLK